jgi:competence protein ComEC
MLWWALELIAGFRYSSVSDYVTIYSVLVYQLGLLILLLCKSLPAKAMGLIYVSALFFIKEPGLRQHEMRMTVLDVGQGLSVLIETENHSLLYDAGFQSSSGFSMGQAVVSPYLDARKIQKVDIGLVSHNDNDHSGGIHCLLNKNRIKKLLISNQRTLYEFDHKDYCRAGNEWNWDGVVFRVLHPASDWRSNDNNRSCVLQAIHPQGKILLTGDIEGSTEKVLSDLYGDKLASDILIVPHHGSKSSSTPGFLARVQPRFAVFSTAYKNRYDFPHADIIKRYRIMGVVTADTQSEGAVMFNIDSAKGIQMSQGYRAISQRYWHSSANRSNQGY